MRVWLPARGAGSGTTILMDALAAVAGVCWRSRECQWCIASFSRGLDILPISAMAMDHGAGALAAPLVDFQDTVLPSADTATLPLSFLYWAAASAMMAGCNVATISEACLA